MKNPLLLAILLLGSINVYTQNVVAPPDNYDENDLIFTKVDKEASFPGD